MPQEPALNNIQEFQNEEELEYFSQSVNEDLVYFQGILIEERLMGPGSRSVLHFFDLR